MNNLISSLERQLAAMMADTALPRNPAGGGANPTNVRMSTVPVPSTRTTTPVTSQDILTVINDYQETIEHYNTNINMLVRLLTRTMQREREAQVNDTPPATTQNLFSNSHVFTFYHDMAMSDENEDPRLTRAQLQQETASVVYDASSAQHTVCPISLDDFVQGEIVTQICGCGHVFKTNYLMRWLERNNYCPVCRYNLLDHSYNDVDEFDRPNPVMTEEYEIVPPNTTDEVPQYMDASDNDVLSDTHYTFEIPLLYDTSSNRLLNPENGERTTARNMQSYIMRELMRGLVNPNNSYRR